MKKCSKKKTDLAYINVSIFFYFQPTRVQVKGLNYYPLIVFNLQDPFLQRFCHFLIVPFRNAPFEGRTACWIPYAETGYTKGKKTGNEKDGKIEVERLVDGKIKNFKPEDVEPQNPPKYELLEDMANMTYLSEVRTF